MKKQLLLVLLALAGTTQIQTWHRHDGWRGYHRHWNDDYYNDDYDGGIFPFFNIGTNSPDLALGTMGSGKNAKVNVTQADKKMNMSVKKKKIEHMKTQIKEAKKAAQEKVKDLKKSLKTIKKH